MAAHEFRNDDSGYATSLSTHRAGYLLNVAASHSPAEATVHHSRCSHIAPCDGKSATGSYRKVCAVELAELERWAAEQAHLLPSACRSCHRVRPARPTAAVRRHVRAPLPEGLARAEGPTLQCRAVQAWADDYLRYGAARPPCNTISATTAHAAPEAEASAGPILHATFVGDKPDDSDVENLLLYNIDAFKTAGANGIRFEQGTNVPPASDGADYPFYYRYELQPASAGFHRRSIEPILAPSPRIEGSPGVAGTEAQPYRHRGSDTAARRHTICRHSDDPIAAHYQRAAPGPEDETSSTA